MLVKLFATLVASITLLCSASANAEIAVGGGYQYGGVLGLKLSKTTGDHVMFASIGLVGGALGYQYVLTADRKHTIGLVLGSEAITSEKGFAALTYNYFTQGADKPGWTWGGSAGVRREDEGGSFANIGDTDTKALVGLHLGYRF
ncbi:MULTISPECIES: hypothetical protein [Pseudoalteromonas]|uniref:hypothetical protein n=1 Tax=Pseudoalteromonas TaxID=53246 RepID=UPI000FFF3951|nr:MULTISPECIES: hypothetical protein [Pseudoalteromonas]NKC21316.1 hypothetical protein [Pseudoalteromonas galatheae]RXE85924.1 hypothetical protein DRB05_13425 [Pseudoalteromonas sp. A757]